MFTTLLMLASLGLAAPKPLPAEVPQSGPTKAPALTPKEIPAKIQELVALYRKGIVCLVDDDEARREKLDVIGKILLERRLESEEALEASLVAELLGSAAKDFKRTPAVARFLDLAESDPGLRDGDKLALLPVVDALVGALADAPGDGPGREALRRRLVADRDALREVEERYRAEARAALEKTRGMTLTREAWQSYVDHVLSVYGPDRLLSEFADEVGLHAPGSRGKRRSDGALEVYGFDLADHQFVLTFDDGPSPEYTAKILDILKERGLHAMFYEVGTHAKEHPELTQRIVEEGHLLGNHTLGHKNLPRLDDAALDAQIDDSRKVLADKSGRPVDLFRPPYGARDARVLAALEKRSLKAWLWTVDSRDWADPVAESIAASTLDQADKMGRGMILFHDVHAQTVDALPLVLDGLKARGHEVVLWDGKNIIGAPAPVAAPAPDVAPAPSPVRVDPAQLEAPRVDPYGESWAVVIGVDDYTHWPKLSYAKGDAEGVAQALQEKYRFQKDHILSLFDQEATRANILSLLGDELPAKVKAEDRVFVFFAGHGTTRTLPDGTQRGYIVPADADRSHLASQALSMSDLQDIHEALAAKAVLFVMDACYGGLALTRAGASEGGDPKRYLNEVTRRRARQILTAGGAEEEVSDYGPGNHSIFTWTLLQALDGQGDLNGDSVVTASELSAFVAPRVSALSKQTPAYGSLLGSQGGEFVFELPASQELLSQATDAVPSDNKALQEEVRKLREQLAQFGGSRGGDPRVEAERYHRIGLELFRNGELEPAAKAFAEAVRLDPTNVRAVNNQGYVLWNMGRFDEAVVLLRQAVNLDPERAVAWLNLGDALRDLKRDDEAKGAWREYLQRWPDSPEAERLRKAVGP